MTSFNAISQVSSEQMATHIISRYTGNDIKQSVKTIVRQYSLREISLATSVALARSLLTIE